ncbi:MAG: hypothetical protein JWR24_1929 [Actinoallomurus sp.]|nr:hypothetical protein [Actinoallomurus sp.]
MKGMDIARKVADAVLYEGYLLYPYRASAVKNQVRWQFGVFVPPGFTATEESSACRTECLIEGGEVLHVRSRFLHVQERTAEGAQPFDEASEREIDAVWQLADLLEGEQVHEVVIPGGQETDGAVTRTCHPLNVRVSAAAERLPGPYGLVRLRLRLENLTEWTGEERPEALRHSLIAAHTLLAVTGGRFVSLLDPPEWARPAVDGCDSLHTWPVLIDDDVMLSSPIILYDRPEIAPESPGDLFDATEIDEILSLRTLTLTDEEKREARATDPRAAEIIDRVEAMPPELLERLHGAIRSPGPRRGWDTGEDDVPVFTTEKPWWDPGADASVSPETDSVTVAGTRVARGSKVRLHPAGRADAQDMFIVGRIATVEAVLFDVDGSQHLAVTIDDDPGTDLRRAQGRYWYFAPDDVEPV